MTHGYKSLQVKEPPPKAQNLWKELKETRDSLH